ncbi:hypothetical protein HK105_200621 [Polyrhizophydium stewartii]|uniref:GH18 domain-containing protein n=1 Tax=Polyrhizophydium stewartii TaxID=2732419 RepID=A0ABR4NJM4_9FUNG|nr:hypothetical protein HK105_000435 [Polyrhizophydium stewartii]
MAGFALFMCAAFAATLPAAVAVPTSQQPALEPRAESTSWKQRVTAPFTDVLLWPTFDISSAASQIDTKHFTLAFITADTAGKASWGGVVPLAQGFYKQAIDDVRKKGGDVIVSFGGANGQELALASSNDLVAEYTSVIDTYRLSRVDFDIEGIALTDMTANTRRAQALASIKRQPKYKDLVISYTLPVLPSGLTRDCLALLKNAADNKLVIDVVNIMAMDYGSAEAPNGDTQMGRYAIAAAQQTYKQVRRIFPQATIGVTPMIGKNDVVGEVFTLDNAKQLVEFARKNAWISYLSFWSINRDTNVYSDALYASSQITQNLFDFSRIFGRYEAPLSRPVVPSIIPKLAGSYNWPTKIYAPVVDSTDSPGVDLMALAATAGSIKSIVGFVVSDNGQPSWGGAHSLAEKWNADKIQKLRDFGGEVIISFGGPTGSELALDVTEPTALQAQYARVVAAYKASWVDFALFGDALADHAAVERRSQAIYGLQSSTQNLRVSITLPVSSITGLGYDALFALDSAMRQGIRVDVVNLLVSDFDAASLATCKAALIDCISKAAESAYPQVLASGLTTAKIGITPSAGKRSSGAVFTINDAKKLVQYANAKPWISMLSLWTANRDSAAASGVAQRNFEFSLTLGSFNN